MKWMVSSTVDAFWLVVAMRSGIPTFLLMVLAIALLAYALLIALRMLGAVLAVASIGLRAGTCAQRG